MKISIESSEPLQDVLRVIGAAYGVTLAVAAADGITAQATTAARSRAGSPRRDQSRRTTRRAGIARGKSTGGLAKVSNAELRSWARQNGYAVSDRGRVPAAVVAAHREAN